MIEKGTLRNMHQIQALCQGKAGKKYDDHNI